MDGTICETRLSHQNYLDVLPKPGAIEVLRKLKAEGHYIIIYSSRHMLTCNNNIGQITAKQAHIFYEWFKKYDIEYDELILGKPLADVYIDDKALKYQQNWDDIYNKLQTL
jgi:capsule biosynthesis phosphatase